jgi:hypothetical protein
MPDGDSAWRDYIAREARAACNATSCALQVRRKWEVREKPVALSSVDDYEWKLIPNSRGVLPEAHDGDFEGRYFVLCFRRESGLFVFQHNTHHGGSLGPNWDLRTFTEIDFKSACRRPENKRENDPMSSPPPYRLRAGWLCEHIVHLVSTTEPNTFSVT